VLKGDVNLPTNHPTDSLFHTCHLARCGYIVYCLCLFFTVTDFSAEDKASSVKFWRRFIGVQGREWQIFVNFAPQKPKIGRIGVLVYCFWFFFCLHIFPPRIKLAASNFARRFIDVQGREYPIFVKFGPSETENWMNWPACGPRALARWLACMAHVLADSSSAWAGHRIGMCG